MTTEEIAKTEKIEKVRGMNASLAGTAEGTGNLLQERDPGRLHISRRQIAFALVLALIAAIAIVYTVNTVSSGSKSYPAVVTSSKVYDLNFANTAKVTDINVKVGQRVNANQVLATQDDGSLKVQEAADETTIQADQQALAATGDPALTPTQQQQDALQVQQAQTALSNAQANLQSVLASGKANVAAAQNAITNDQTLVQGDNTRYTQACPNGPTPPGPGLSGAALQQAQASFERCQQLQATLSQDQSTLSAAQAQLGVVEAQAQQSANSAQATVNSAQAALNLAGYQGAVQSAPSSTQAQAQATLNQAKAQLAQVQQQIADATIVAPDSGVISEVYGVAGEELGPNGVHTYQAPAGLPQTQSPGFNLFPSQPAASGSSTSNSGSEPTIELVGGSQQVKAQVPESDVGNLPVGHQAKVSIPALSLTQNGTVTEVVLSATRNSTQVTYDVFITLDRTVPGLLPGMSATVSA